MKKDKLWAKLEIRKELESWQNIESGIDEDGIKYVLNIIDQLDEPETLSIDKEQLIKRIENYIPLHDKTVGDVVDGILEIVKQLPEMEVLSPKWIDDNTQLDMNPTSRVVPAFLLENILVPNQELPEIPSFVAHWIEDLKSKKINLLESIYFTHNEDINNYIREQSDVLMRAWLDGYDVAEEQKYYVDLDTAAYVAKWKDNGQVNIYTDGIAGSDDFEFHLTEQEIKDYDERYIPFMVPVDEVNND